MYHLNPFFKHHTLVGVFIGLWVFVFTFFIKPFDGGGANLNSWWLFLSGGFSTITFTSYYTTIIFQDFIYEKLSKWNIILEILILIIFNLLNLIFTYEYYKSPLLNGILNFEQYSLAFLKSAIIFTPILIFARRFILKFIPKKETDLEKEEEKTIIIKGDYKLDFLKILKADLVCISKSQNYIEVFYLENGQLKSKLIRSSLKKVQENLDFLTQVHRSHLINSTHFKSWKNQNTISLTQIEIPISKNYKQNLSSL